MGEKNDYSQNATAFRIDDSQWLGIILAVAVIFITLGNDFFLFD